MFTGRYSGIFRLITRPGSTAFAPAVAIRRSCSKRVLGDGRYRTKVLLGLTSLRRC